MNFEKKRLLYTRLTHLNNRSNIVNHAEIKLLNIWHIFLMCRLSNNILINMSNMTSHIVEKLSSLSDKFEKLLVIAFNSIEKYCFRPLTLLLYSFSSPIGYFHFPHFLAVQTKYFVNNFFGSFTKLPAKISWIRFFPLPLLSKQKYPNK